MALNLAAMQQNLPKDYYHYLAVDKQILLYDMQRESMHTILPELGNKLIQLLSQLKSPPRPIQSIISSAAKIRFESHSRQYSGLYTSGSLGFIRFALSANFEPMIEIKFLIDESPSLNLKFQGSKHEHLHEKTLFTHELNAHASFVDENLLYHPQYDTIEHQVNNLALRSSNGRLVFEINIPRHLNLVPSETLKSIMLEYSARDFRTALATLPPGSLLYEVYTNTNYSDFPCHIASIVLDSEFIASSMGDLRLFS